MNIFELFVLILIMVLVYVINNNIMCFLIFDNIKKTY